MSCSFPQLPRSAPSRRAARRRSSVSTAAATYDLGFYHCHDRFRPLPSRHVAIRDTEDEHFAIVDVTGGRSPEPLHCSAVLFSVAGLETYEPRRCGGYMIPPVYSGVRA